jgi:hypothetical protein
VENWAMTEKHLRPGTRILGGPDKSKAAPPRAASTSHGMAD